MKEVTKERNRPTYSGKQYKQHQHREKIFLENHINAIKSKNKHKDEVSFTNRCVQDIVTVVDECKFVNPFDFDITNRCICFRRISYDYESPYEYGDALAQHLIII